MKLLNYYVKRKANKRKLKVTYDKKSKDRPSWIEVKGLSKGVNFIMVHLGKKGKKGQRIQFYKTYLPEGLFLPIWNTKEEMREFYNKFSETYDKDITNNKQNIEMGKFFCKKLKKYINNNASILDLGAGTGLLTEIFVDAGFYNITLLDYSKGMLDKAKKNKKLKNCKFILNDMRNLKLEKKYDVMLSIFSLGSSSYFREDEFIKTLKLIKKYLKPKGIIAVIGYYNKFILEQEFKKLESGIYILNKKLKYYTDYFIGRK